MPCHSAKLNVHAKCQYVFCDKIHMPNSLNVKILGFAQTPLRNREKSSAKAMGEKSQQLVLHFNLNDSNLDYTTNMNIKLQ